MKKCKIRCGIFLFISLILIFCGSALAADNTIKTATEINVNTKMDITSDSYSEWYKFTIPSDGFISFTLIKSSTSQMSSYGNIGLYRIVNEVEPISSSSLSTSESVINTTNVGLSAGTYYVYLYYGKGSMCVNYTSASDWEKEDNNTVGSATEIPLNTEINGTFHSIYDQSYCWYEQDDEDWYKFTLTDPGTVCFSFNHDLFVGYTNSNEIGWYSYLYSGDGNLTMIQKDSYQISTMANNSQPVGLSAGTYYVLIERTNNDKQVLDYKLQVNYSTAVSECELNDDYTSANMIQLNTEYKGSDSNRSNGSDIDWYKINIQKTGDYYIYLTNYTDSNYRDWSDLYVRYSYSTLKEIVHYSASDYSFNTEKLVFELYLTQGDYYIELKPDNSQIYYLTIAPKQTTTGFTNDELLELALTYAVKQYPLISPLASWLVEDSGDMVEIAAGKYALSPNPAIVAQYYVNRKGVGIDRISNKKVNLTNPQELESEASKTKKSTKTKITITTKPSSVKAKVKKNKVTVSWKKIKNNKAGKKLLKQIKSIQVQYSTDKKFKKDVKTKKVGKSKTKITLKLKKKTTYYIRVRYKGSSGYSKWSSVKKVKTK